MIQKVIKVGSSAAIVIPKKSLKELGFRIGDTVSVSTDRKAKRLLIEPSAVADKELIEWTDKFIEKYRPALEALAKK